MICAGITTYKGIKETEAKPGEWIAISGCGGLGHLGIQYAKAMGLHVCGIDVDDGKLAHAKRLGAEIVINAKTGNPAAILKKEIGGGAHGVLITAPSLPAFKQGVEMTRKHGICVLVGLPPGEFPLPLFDVVANCVTVRGSFVGTREDMAECLQFAAEGRVKADIETPAALRDQHHFRTPRERRGAIACRARLCWRQKSKGVRSANTRSDPGLSQLCGAPVHRL